MTDHPTGCSCERCKMLLGRQSTTVPDTPEQVRAPADAGGEEIELLALRKRTQDFEAYVIKCCEEHCSGVGTAIVDMVVGMAITEGNVEHAVSMLCRASKKDIIEQLRKIAYRYKSLQAQLVFKPTAQDEGEISKRSVLAIGADRMALAIDRLVEMGRLDARSEAADARLDYGEPYKYGKIVSEIASLQAKLAEKDNDLQLEVKAVDDLRRELAEKEKEIVSVKQDRADAERVFDRLKKAQKRIEESEDELNGYRHYEPEEK